MAAKNSGGIVMVQVENVVEAGSLSPRDVEIPGAWVDAVVIAEPGNYMQTFRTPFSPGFTGRYQGAHRRPCRSGPECAKKINARVEGICGGLDHKVDGIVNYDGRVIHPKIEEQYAAQIQKLEQRFYRTARRYSASAFVRMTLGKVFARSDAAQIFESQIDAKAFLDGKSGA